MPKSSRRRLANPLLPGASPGARSIPGPLSNSKTTQWHCVDRGAIAAPAAVQLPLRGHEGRRFRATRSSWLHVFQSGTRKTAIRAVWIGEILGAAPRCPTISNSAKALVVTHAAGFGERPVQLRLADRSPVAQPAERPTLNREVDGANPSGAATHCCAQRAASRAGRSLADRRTDIAEAGGAEPPRRTNSQSSRSSMYRAPRFGRGGCRRNSCREHHLLFPA